MSDTPQLPQNAPQTVVPVSSNIAIGTGSKPTVAAPPVDREADKIKTSDGAQTNPLREVLQRLEKVQPMLAAYDAKLADTVTQLKNKGNEPEAFSKQDDRHKLAYAFQDVERAVGRLELPPQARTEVTRLAESATGLENERMLALMRSTGAMSHQGVVDTVRIAGRGVGREADQNTPQIISMIDALENKIRLLQTPGAAVASAAAPDGPKPPQGGGNPPGGDRPNNDQPNDHNNNPNDGPRTGSKPNNGNTGSQFILSRSPFDTIFSALRPRETDGGAPWEAAHTPMKDRIAAFEIKVQERTDGETLARAEKSGRAALDALQGFAAGEGAVVMNRIREAAKAEPGGMASVLAEMKEGGRFADLRGQFNNALLDDRGVTAAYDRAATALAGYGDKRTSLDEVIARRPDAANLAAKFDRMDQELGDAASQTPSRRDGKSMVDDLAKAASELFSRAVDGLKSMFSRTPNAEASSRPGPSPSP